MHDATTPSSNSLSPASRASIETPWPGQCFGCSRHNPHGLQLRFVPTEKGCRTQCEVPDRFCGFDGIAHGGMTSLLLDEVAAWTLCTQLGQLGLTANLSAQYHDPVPTGAELVVEGTLVRHDAKKALVRSTVRSADGELLADAESTWVLTTLARFSELMEVPESALQQFFSALKAELRRHPSAE